MVKRYKVTTKITAAVLTLLMVVSVFSGAIELPSASALSSKDYKVVTADSIETLETQSSNRAPYSSILQSIDADFALKAR